MSAATAIEIDPAVLEKARRLAREAHDLSVDFVCDHEIARRDGTTPTILDVAEADQAVQALEDFIGLHPELETLPEFDRTSATY